MPYAVTEFQSTPNPNAVKCILDKSIRDPKIGPGSYRSASAAVEDPVASAFFSIKGVNNVLINNDWITVGKEPAADWRSIKAAVTKTLAGLA